MRIGFATDNYKPYISGVTHYISINRRYLEARGHEVFVFAFGDPKAPPVEPNVVLSPGAKIRGTANFRLGPRFTREATRLLATMDVVHVDNPLVSGLFALNVCRRHGIPVVYTNHTRIDLFAEHYARFVPSVARGDMLRLHMRQFCRRADLVISPTESVAQVLRDMGVGVPIEVVPNGVDIERFLMVARGFRAAEDVASVHRTEMGFARDDLVFVFSGRLAPEKNLPLLVDAFALVAKEIPQARLLLVGGGPQHKRIVAAGARHGLGDRVTLTGMVPYESIPEYLGLCDVWVSPSVTEVHPLTLIESMAAGLPIIGVASPGVSDTIEPGVTGLLAPKPEAEGLARRMIELAHDPERRHSMGVAARAAAKCYSIESTGAEILGVYERLVEASSARAARKAGMPTRQPLRIGRKA